MHSKDYCRTQSQCIPVYGLRIAIFGNTQPKYGNMVYRTVFDLQTFTLCTYILLIRGQMMPKKIRTDTIAYFEYVEPWSINFLICLP